MVDEITLQNQEFFAEKKPFSLETAIASIRHADSVFNVKSSFQFEMVASTDKTMIQQSFSSQISSTSISKLSINNLNELNSGIQSVSAAALNIDNCDVYSSSKDTEYSISQMQVDLTTGKIQNAQSEQTEKQRQKRRIEREKRNLIRDLKAENEKYLINAKQMQLRQRKPKAEQPAPSKRGGAKV